MKRAKSVDEEKPESIAFSSASRKHVTQTLGLNYGPKLRLLLPRQLPNSVPSETLIGMLESASKGQLSLSSEAGRSAIILAFILDAQRQYPSHLTTMQQVQLSWKQFEGVMDIAVCTEDHKSLLLVVEAKRGWNDDNIYQLLAEAGCILERREQVLDKNSPVLAILSDAYHFQFFAIDERDKSVYRSKFIALDILGTTDFKEAPQVSEILNWIIWFLKIVVSTTPRDEAVLTKDDTTHSQGEQPILQELRNCFVRQ